MRAIWIALVLLTVGCRSGGLSGLSDLAQEPPLPYSVLVTGGAFIEPGPGPEAEEPMERTYRPTGELSEAFSLATVASALSQGRVFVRIQEDTESSHELRARLAGQQGPVPTDRSQPQNAELNDFLQRARGEGYDFLLVLERVQDGPVEFRGINGQWPLTLAVWILVGLGALIPDHTYESQAALHVELRDVQSGRKLYDHVLRGGSVNLPLLERTDFWGVLSSIIVPPFWVGDDAAGVEATIRGIASAQLIVSLARQLKSVDVATQISSQMPATFDVQWDGNGLRVEIRAREALSVVRMRLDQVAREFESFEANLLASRQREGGELIYRASLPRNLEGRSLQLLVQTVTGRVASTTIRRGE